MLKYAKFYHLIHRSENTTWRHFFLANFLKLRWKPMIFSLKLFQIPKHPNPYTLGSVLKEVE